MAFADLLQSLQGLTEKATRLKEKNYKLNYGVNRLADRLTLPDEYCYTIRNAYVTKANWIEQRNGYTRVTTGAIKGAPKIRKLFEFEDINGSQTIIGRGGTGWYRHNSGGVKDDGLANGGFETWETELSTDGTFEAAAWSSPTALTNWSMTGVDATLAREATIIKSGTYSAKVTRVGNDCHLSQNATVDEDTEIYMLNVWVYQTAGSADRAGIKLGGGTSVYHSGVATGWERLTATYTNNSSAGMYIYLLNQNTDGSAYFDVVQMYKYAGPTSWTVTGANATAYREPTQKYAGTYSAKLTRAGTDCNLNQDIQNALSHNLAYWKGRDVTLTGRIYSENAGTARLTIDDGVNTSSSLYHNGDATWQEFTATITVSTSATSVTARLECNNSDVSAYFDAFTFEDDETGGWVPIDIGRAADAYSQMCQFTYYGIMCDGAKPRKFDYSFTVTDVDATDAPAKSSCCHTHNHRLVVNDDDAPLSFRISKVDSLDFDVTGSDAAIINLSAVVPVGDRIIGFSTYLSTYLIVWLRRHIVVYDLPTTTANIKLQQVIRTGCLSYDGIIYTAAGDILYPNETGYKSFIQSFTTQSILSIKDETALINPYYRRAMTEISAPEDIVGINYKTLDHSYFKIPFASDPEIWIMSEDLKVATGGKGNIAGFFTGINPYSFLVDHQDRLLFGGDDGHMYQMDDGTNDNGSAILFEVERTGINMDNPSIFKKPKEFESVMEVTGNLDLFLTYSFGVDLTSSGGIVETLHLTTTQAYWDEAQWDIDFWDATGQLQVRTRNLLGRGKYMNFKVSHQTLDVKIAFPYWILRYFNLGVD